MGAWWGLSDMAMVKGWLAAPMASRKVVPFPLWDAMSRKRAASRTERVSGPSAMRPFQPEACSGPSSIRPRCGLRPTRPVSPAGYRTEPPPSLPSAIAAMPVQTAAADPPDEPPGVRSRSHGLRVTPHVADDVHGHSVSSGTLVLPMMMAPA